MHGLKGKVYIFWEGHNILWNLHRNLSGCSASQITMEISQNVEAFSEYMNFKNKQNCFFFIKVDDIMAEDYLPREDDILRARKITQGMDQLTFKQNVSFI